MAESKPKLLRYYIRDSVVPFEEDMYHEFKGHRNLSVEELPPWTKESSDGRERELPGELYPGTTNQGHPSIY